MASEKTRVGAIRVLFLSNYFPPFANGGYEQWCSEMAAALVERGHVVHVLTSRVPSAAGPETTRTDRVVVHRRLHLELEGGLVETAGRLLWQQRAIERHNLEQLRSVIDLVRPDVALIWGMWNVPRAVPAQVEQLMRGRVIYYFCDYWPALPSAYVQRWEAPARHASASIAKRLVGRVALARLRREPSIALQLERPLCVSRAVQRKLVQANVAVEHGQVVYGGTQLAEAAAARPAREPRSPDCGPRLLYAGRLTPGKGVHVPILALAELEEVQSAVTLSVVGGGEPDYAQELRRLARACGVATRVTFRGSASASEMPAMVAEHDVLVLASDWEAFPRVVLEAMAAGLVVVGTTDGGTSEVLVEGETGLTFPYGDARALADQIRRLHTNPSLWHRLAQAGQERVRREFTFSRMVDQFETQLGALDGQRAS